MIYRSNLTAPDLTKYFRYLHVRPMPHSFGHSVPSDWADKREDDPIFGLYKKCGMLTHDEGAVVYNIACRVKGHWLDIGSHTGWSSAHIKVAGVSRVVMIDPMYGGNAFSVRALENMRHIGASWFLMGETSNAFFGRPRTKFEPKIWDGVLIDGDHSKGKPLEDAINAAKHLADTGVIIFHDGVGRPVREAVQYLMAQGFHCRAYYSPHMIFVCWRGDFTPPDHVPDPNVKAQLLDGRLSDFDFTRCS